MQKEQGQIYPLVGCSVATKRPSLMSGSSILMLLHTKINLSSLSSLYNLHEKEKMRKYNSRVLTVEKGSFTPLVYTTFGGWGRQATVYHERIASKIASKRNEEYSKVMDFMRTRICFSLLRSTLTAIRGDRGKSSAPKNPLSNVSFNLIPSAMQYESY